tara:strand:+ start:335 stop:559 length:225 start_codon:yes stop_codon:yes gene_type:complete
MKLGQANLKAEMTVVGAVNCGKIFRCLLIVLTVIKQFLFLVSEIVEAGVSLLVRAYMIASHKAKGTKQLKETII